MSYILTLQFYFGRCSVPSSFIYLGKCYKTALNSAQPTLIRILKYFINDALRNHSLNLCLLSIFPDVSVVIPVLPGTTGQRLALSLEDCMTPKSVRVNQSVYSCSVWVCVHWNWVCVWQAADPTPSLPVSIMSTALARPARVFRKLLSVHSSALMGTRHPILRTNTLVQALKRDIIVLAISMSSFHKWRYCFLCPPPRR